MLNKILTLDPNKKRLIIRVTPGTITEFVGIDKIKRGDEFLVFESVTDEQVFIAVSDGLICPDGTGEVIVKK